MSFKLQIITPESTVLDGDVESITVPGTAGSMGILSRHAPMVAALDIGIVKYVPTGPSHPSYLVIGNGMVKVGQDSTVLMAEIVITAADFVDAEEKMDILRQEQKSLFVSG